MKYLISLALLFSVKVLAQTSVMPVYDQGIYPSKNYVKNPSCSKNVANITASGGSLAKNTSTPLDKSSDCAIDASSSGQTYTFAVNTMDNSLKGSNCQANFIYTGDASLYKAYVNINSVKVTTDLQLLNSGSGVSKPVKIFFPCGDLSTATTVVIESTSASAAAINVAKVYAGEAYDLSNQPAPAEFVGSLKYAGATNCEWSVTSGTFSGFSADTDCNAASVTGSVTAPGTKIPAFVLANVKPGTYRFVATGSFYRVGTGGSCFWRFNDGTTGTSAQGQFNSGGISGFANSIEGFITYTAPQSNVTVNVQVFHDATQACDIYNQNTSQDLSFNVYYYPSSSQQAIRQDCVGTADCENIFYAYVPTGGTVSKENVDWINGNCSGTNQKTCTFNTGLFSAAPSCLCTVGESSGGTNSCRIDSISTTQILFTTTNDSVAEGDKNATISCSRQLSDRKPQTNAPILVGGISSASTVAERIERIRYYTTSYGTVCSSSPCTVSSSNSGITVTRTSAGLYTINFPSGTFSAPPTCTFFASNNANVMTVINLGYAVPTSTAYIFNSYIPAGGTADTYGDILCMGPR